MCRLSRSAIAVAPTAVSRAVLERPGCSKMSFENSSAGREAAAHCQNAANCSVISKWGTPKTPAPSGPLTLYVGPSRDAGRLRARQDRHRAAAPALSERRRTFQTDSLSRPGPAAGLGAGRAFAASGGPLCWRAADHPRQSANDCILSPVGGDVPSRVTSCRPTRSSLQVVSKCPPTLLTLAADLHSLSRSSSLCFKAPRGHLPLVPEPPGPANLPQPKSSPAGSQRLRNWGRVGKLQSIAL